MAFTVDFQTGLVYEGVLKTREYENDAWVESHYEGIQEHFLFA